tara:strand:- start:78 stop:230 length:153 start_codon:yes stop_codon:yes gene_type:complete
MIGFRIHRAFESADRPMKAATDRLNHLHHLDHLDHRSIRGARFNRRKYCL